MQKEGVLQIFTNLIKFDPISLILIALILIISSFVAAFAKNYLDGDRQHSKFYLHLVLLTISVALVVLANDLWLFFTSWVCSNILLVRMMIHKKSWLEAYESGKLALRNFAFGFLTLFIAVYILTSASSASSFEAVFQSLSGSWLEGVAFVLLLITAMIQSAQLPFSSWLLSSLNSPTPVSAFMHAGLVNGGGILLAKFAPLYLTNVIALNIIFIVGACTALFGSGVMVLQAKIKNKLASSTVGQMGFMFMEIGMGMIPVAIAHLAMHGFFKAYLFLNSGSSVEKVEISQEINKPVSGFIYSLIAALFALLIFSSISGFYITSTDTRAIQCIFVLITLTQFMFSCLRANKFWLFRSMSIVFAFVFAAFYGYSVLIIEEFTHKMGLMQAQAISLLHIVFTVFFILLWLTNVVKNSGFKFYEFIPMQIRNLIYVKLVNFSSPHAKTITSKRGDYSY